MTSGADDQPPGGDAAADPPKPRPSVARGTRPSSSPARPPSARRPAAGSRPAHERQSRPAAAPPSQRRPRPAGPTTEDADKAPRSDPQKRMVVILSVLTVLVAGLVLYAVVGRSSGGGGPSTTIVPPPNPSTTVPAEQLTTFTDAETGFNLKYPKSWKVVGAPVRDLRLALDAGGGTGLSVRVVRTEQPTTLENIDNLDAFTEAAVNLNPSAKIIRKDRTTLNGMPAYYYLYTFRDDETGQEGVHAHYFAFQGRKMNVLVFQVLPADDFERLAPTFDQVANSFRSDPDIAPSTTVPATTTTAPAG